MSKCMLMTGIKGAGSCEKGEIQATASNNPDLLTSTVLEVIGQYQAGQTSFPDYVYIPPF